MFLKIDSLGETLRDFESLRDELAAAGRRFSAENLRFVPYEKLALCATGVAGAAMCSPSAVREEKRARRERFANMSEDDIRRVWTVLQIERMDADVQRERARNAAPRWEDLHPRQRAWLKLNCVQNHLDGVVDRMREAIALLQEAADKGDLPPDFAVFQRHKLEMLLQVYPVTMTDRVFRAKVSEIALEIKSLLPDDEQRVCEAEILFNYSCSSDCYRPLV